MKTVSSLIQNDVSIFHQDFMKVNMNSSGISESYEIQFTQKFIPLTL